MSEFDFATLSIIQINTKIVIVRELVSQKKKKKKKKRVKLPTNRLSQILQK